MSSASSILGRARSWGELDLGQEVLGAGQLVGQVIGRDEGDGAVRRNRVALAKGGKPDLGLHARMNHVDVVGSLGSRDELLDGYIFMPFPDMRI